MLDPLRLLIFSQGYDMHAFAPGMQIWASI